MLEEQQKPILLADHSKQGWGMVEDYLADNLAKYSDDERRIGKAEKMAERKASKRRKKRQVDSMVTRPRNGGQRFPPYRLDWGGTCSL